MAGWCFFFFQTVARKVTLHYIWGNTSLAFGDTTKNHCFSTCLTGVPVKTQGRATTLWAIVKTSGRMMEIFKVRLCKPDNTQRVSPGEHCKPSMALVQALLPAAPMYVHFCSNAEEEKVRKCWYFVLCIHRKSSLAFPLLLLLLCDRTCDL